MFKRMWKRIRGAKGSRELFSSEVGQPFLLVPFRVVKLFPGTSIVVGMDNHSIADVFDQVADLLEFQSANPFRVRAYRNGARTIRDYAEPLAAIRVVHADMEWPQDAGRHIGQRRGTAAPR